VFHKSLFDQRACHDVSLQVTLKGIAALYKLATKLQANRFPPRQRENDGFNDTCNNSHNEHIWSDTLKPKPMDSSQDNTGTTTAIQA
jgi:hypothetical protein